MYTIPDNLLHKAKILQNNKRVLEPEKIRQNSILKDDPIALCYNLLLFWLNLTVIMFAPLI